MPKSHFINDAIIYLKVQNSYAVWFKASRKFLMIEEPAFYALKLFIKNVQIREIAGKFSKRYNADIKEVERFILELEVNFQLYLNQVIEISREKQNVHDGELQFNNFHSNKIYSIEKHIFKIHYGDRELENVIHPLIAHHEINKAVEKGHNFETYRKSGKLIFRADNEIVEIFDLYDTGYLKAAVLLKLLGIIHNISSEYWMMTVHAAAITDGITALVFPAMAGSGKSTLSALMQAHGFDMLSDDFLAIDVKEKKIYPLPVAATIKEGSFKVLKTFFPQLNEISPEIAYTGKQVRYLPINNGLKPNNGFAAAKFVFINYSENNPFKFEKVAKKTALQLMLQETWVNPVSSSVSEFFNWFDNTSFFKLSYSKTSEALKVVGKLFNE